MKALQRIDFYRNVPVDLTEPTIPGAIISLLCGTFMVFLLLSEFSNFIQYEETTEMVVQQEEGGTIRMNLNITFMRMPCFVFSLDVLDIMGRHEVGFGKTIIKTRISREGATIGPLDTAPITEAQAVTMKEEGCNVVGYVELNKVPGSFHISAHGAHAEVAKYLGSLNVNHFIHTFHLGEERLNPLEYQVPHLSRFEGSLHPLDSTRREEDVITTYEYFMNIIPTIYSNPDLIDLKAYQMTVHSHQFPTGHSQMSAVFFRYQLSPITVKFIKRKRTLSHFLTYVCAIVGGVFTVAGLLNSLLHSAMRIVRKNVLGKSS
eukprot:NODE_4987_length_1084_cov_46.464100_g4434_i0.p1 GENE.NODE_4987_length_1084_cov_46.464100_g4434_i0~~NODE_4987_length_1084_cov_46.464100_g4434_i0.p1  ORF type:complete len:318 (-),score=60.80 NODE_4987_length_1084_cov_46.464100_g4434_i0:50-1003(-)